MRDVVSDPSYVRKEGGVRDEVCVTPIAGINEMLDVLSNFGAVVPR